MSLFVSDIDDGPEIILLHGWGLHGGVWSRLCHSWLPGFRKRIIDLPGHGRSRGQVFAGNPAAIANEILDVVPRRAIWLGWSLGGMLALMIARLAPERVEKLILVGTSPRFVQVPDWPHAMTVATLTRFAEDLAADYANTLVRFLSLQTGKTGFRRGVLRDLRRIAREQPPPDAQALQTGLALLQQTDLRPILAGIDRPVLVVHGQGDKLVPRGAADYLHQHLPDARLVIMNHAGHAPFLSHPDRFREIVGAFVGGDD